MATVAPTYGDTHPCHKKQHRRRQKLWRRNKNAPVKTDGSVARRPRRDSNARPSPPQGDALIPLSYEGTL